MERAADQRAGLSAELRRERLLDLEERMAPYRRRAFVALGISLVLAGPFEGWWWVFPLAAALGAFAVVDRRIAASGHPDRWMAAGWAVSPLMIAVSVALTGANVSPAAGWFALPAITLGMRFERRGVLVGAAYIGALMVGSLALVSPDAILHDPTPLIFTAGLTVAALFLSSTVVQSERDHRQSSVVDPLTGLLNRAALAQKIEDLGPSGDPPRKLGLLIGDVDHFKRINDQDGHAAGDAVLRDVAYSLAGALRSFDLAYRIGGEEFLILLPDADERGVAQVAERLRQSVHSCSRPGVRVSMSFGGVSGNCDGANFDTLSAAADRALYDAKNTGRDRVVMAGEATVALPERRRLPVAPAVQPA